MPSFDPAAAARRQRKTSNSFGKSQSAKGWPNSRLLARLVALVARLVVLVARLVALVAQSSAIARS